MRVSKHPPQLRDITVSLYNNSIRGVARGGDEGVKTPPHLRDITVSADEILEELAQKPRHLPFRLA